MITWTQQPRFEIIENDGRWDRFVCVAAGLAEVNGHQIYFPLDWITDAASVPKLLRSIVDQLGPHLPAVLIHDRMLELGYPRKVARAALVAQLKELRQVTRFRRFAITVGVWGYDTFIQ